MSINPFQRIPVSELTRKTVGTCNTQDRLARLDQK